MSDEPMKAHGDVCGGQWGTHLAEQKLQRESYMNNTKSGDPFPLLPKTPKIIGKVEKHMSPQCYFCRSKNGGRALEFERSQQISGRWDDGGGERNEGGQGSHRIPPGSRTPHWRNASSVMQNA